MTEQDKIDVAIEAIAITIEEAPYHVGNIIFQCNQEDLRLYRTALASESVVKLAIQKQLFISVITIEKGTMLPYLESLDNY